MKLSALLAGAAAALGAVTSVQASGADPMTSAVRSLSTGAVIAGGQARLVTNLEGASMTLRTSSLTPSDVTTVWWIVFNNPAACSGPAPGHPFNCGPSDLGNPAVQASILYAAGHEVGGSGQAGFAAHLATGDTGGALFGPGLINPLSAHIHLVVCGAPSFSPACLVQFAVFEQPAA